MSPAASAAIASRTPINDVAAAAVTPTAVTGVLGTETSPGEDRLPGAGSGGGQSAPADGTGALVLGITSALLGAAALALGRMHGRPRN